MKVIQEITDCKKEEKEEQKELLHSILRHDLLNKTNIIQGYLELLKDTKLSEKQEQYLKKAEKTTRACFELIKKMRTIRRVGKEKVGEINISKTIKNVISEYESQASEKGMEIEYEKREYEVRGGSLLVELLSNLVENSIRHSGGSKIKISTRETGDECIITIEDDGCRVPDEDKEKLFQKDYKKGEAAGTGLGLYIVKEVAENYNGSVKVKDSELGGARLDVHLKKAQRLPD